MSVNKMQRCWFCGEQRDDLTFGWSARAMLMSDFRYDSPQLGEFDSNVIDLRDPIHHALICPECISRFLMQCGEVTEAYLRDMADLSEELSVQVSDIATGLISASDRQLSYGCWFGAYPATSQSIRFSGKRLHELITNGSLIFPSMVVPREFVYDYLEDALLEPLDPSVKIGDAIDMTRGLIVSDGDISNDDRLKIVQSRVWILDATLILHLLKDAQ